MMAKAPNPKKLEFPKSTSLIASMLELVQNIQICSLHVKCF